MEKERSYIVCVSVSVRVGGSVQVEAKTKTEAQDKAIDKLMTERHYSITDFDGNRVDFDAGDIDILAVNPE